jgi:hypothetical protein
MKRIFLTRNFLASQNAQDFCALLPNRSLLAASSTTLFEVLFRSTQLIGAWCGVLCAAAQLRSIFRPFLPTIEFA